MPDEFAASFSSVKERLDEIADEVSREDLPLDDALALYEEAVKLGLLACDLSETDLAESGRGQDADAPAVGAFEPLPEEASPVEGASQPVSHEAGGSELV